MTEQPTRREVCIEKAKDEFHIQNAPDNRCNGRSFFAFLPTSVNDDRFWAKIDHAFTAVEVKEWVDEWKRLGVEFPGYDEMMEYLGVK